MSTRLLGWKSWQLRPVHPRGEVRERLKRSASKAIGYIKTEEQLLEKDPDRRVQQAIVLVFEKFLELGSVRQTLLWFLEQGLEMPARNQLGETCWKRPSYGTVYRILTGPVYGGAYAYGRTEHTLRYEEREPRKQSRRKPREQWLVLIRNAHEGYVSWERFEQIQQAIASNDRGWEQSGAVQNGPALLRLC